MCMYVGLYAPLWNLQMEQHKLHERMLGSVCNWFVVVLKYMFKLLVTKQQTSKHVFCTLSRSLSLLFYTQFSWQFLTVVFFFSKIFLTPQVCHHHLPRTQATMSSTMVLTMSLLLYSGGTQSLMEESQWTTILSVGPTLWQPPTHQFYRT